MAKRIKLKVVKSYIKIAEIFLVAAYNNIEYVKKSLKKKDFMRQSGLRLAQANVASILKKFDRMLKEGE